MQEFYNKIAGGENVLLNTNTNYTILIIGLAVVIGCLILFTLIIKLSANGRNIKNDGAINNKEVKAENIESVASNNVNLDNNGDLSDDELVAIFTTCIMASFGNTTRNNLIVKSFKRIPGSSPVWNVAGRRESIELKF